MSITESLFPNLRISALAKISTGRGFRIKLIFSELVTAKATFGDYDKYLDIITGPILDKTAAQAETSASSINAGPDIYNMNRKMKLRFPLV